MNATCLFTYHAFNAGPMTLSFKNGLPKKTSLSFIILPMEPLYPKKSFPSPGIVLNAEMSIRLMKYRDTMNAIVESNMTQQSNRFFCPTLAEKFATNHWNLNAVTGVFFSVIPSVIHLAHKLFRENAAAVNLRFEPFDVHRKTGRVEKSVTNFFRVTYTNVKTSAMILLVHLAKNRGICHAIAKFPKRKSNANKVLGVVGRFVRKCFHVEFILVSGIVIQVRICNVLPLVLFTPETSEA